MPDGTMPQPGGWNRFSLDVSDLAAMVDIVQQVKESGKLALVGVRRNWCWRHCRRACGNTSNGAIGYTQRCAPRNIANGRYKNGRTEARRRYIQTRWLEDDAWCVGNARIVPTPTAMRVARDEAGLGKIDPLMAVFDAAELMATNPLGGAIDIAAMVA